MAFLLNSGNGSFSVGATLTLTGGFVELGDVDNDGDIDLLRVLNQGVAADLLVSLNDGAGTFGVANAFPITRNPNSILMVDVTGDGFLDAITTHSPGSGQSDSNVIVNNGDGTFAAAVVQ